jgi:predicted flap endonuclease-1-like 5' DNA nuclease
MLTLALQIFLLLLAAFLLGCILGCLIRRAVYAARYQPATETVAATAATAGVAATTAVAQRPISPEAQRFESALTGADAAQLSTVRREPVVEVRPRAPEPVRAEPIIAEPVTREPVGPQAAASIQQDVPQPAPAAPPQSEIVAEQPQRSLLVEQPVVAQEHATPTQATYASQPIPPPPPPPPSDLVANSESAGESAPDRAPAPAPAPEAEVAREAVVTQPEPVSQASSSAIGVAAAAAAAAASSATTAPVFAQPRAESAVAGDGEPADDLKRIRSIDSILEGRLNALGVTRYSQIAGWTSADVTRMSQSLGLVGRIEQENWIEQAHILARGGETDYARRRRDQAPGSAAAAAHSAASHAASQSAGPDRLTRIIGVDAATEQALIGLGITRYADIARWSPDDVARMEAQLGRPGRISLDNWVEQARVLARYADGTDAPRPVRLADAIRENREQAQRATASEPAPRSDLAGLRSVRSEALRGEAPAPTGREDDLKRIRGIGVLIEKRLNSLGVTTYEQIANWTGADIDRISQILDFKGRIERENWIEQARILASGGHTEFSRRVDRGEVDSSRDG